MPSKDQVSAVVLAGGMARRMGGVDKGWMALNGKPLIRHVVETVQPQVKQCLINANRSLDAYGTLGIPVVCDLEEGFQGPLMGIATGLFHAHSDWVLFVPCDCPNLPDDLVQRLLDKAHAGVDLVVAHDGQRLQPVVALIKKDLLSSVRATLAEGERKIDRWYALHNMATADFSDQKEAFLNVNRKEELAELQQMPKLLGFAAWSGTGKTTLLKQLIPLLKARGIRVGVIKHAHHQFDVDHPGKDSYELRKAGADNMLICSGKRWALMVEEEQGDRPALMQMIQHLDRSLDLILVEGFKQESFPKIELHRPALGRDLMHGDDESIIAFAADEPVAMQRDIPILDINDPEAILSFIQGYLNADKDDLQHE